jgi:hypothetical protein
MCLACELDALWYAEWDRLAAEGAARSAGAPSALSEESPGTAEITEGAEDSSPAQTAGAAEIAGETPADSGSPLLRPAASRFRCEETE